MGGGFILDMALDELAEILGKEYRFKYEHSQKLINFLANTQTIADLNFYLSYNICRAGGEKFVLDKLQLTELERLLTFYNETLPRITLNGHKSGYRNASILHQNFANVYSKLFDIDGNTTHLENAIEHSLKSTEYAGTDAHKSYTYGFIGEFARKIFQKTKDRASLPWSEKALEHYKKSRELSQNSSHKAHCVSYIADIFRDIYEVTNVVRFANEAINNYLISADELRKIKPEQAFHNLSYAADVAFAVFAKTDDVSYLTKSHTLYHMALREDKTKKHEGVVRTNLLRTVCKLYDALHTPTFVQEAFHQAILSLQTELKPRSESYVIAMMSDLCVKLPPDFIILQDQMQKLIPFAQKFSGDHRAHILLSSIYRNKFKQTRETSDLELMFDSLDNAIKFAPLKGQKAHNSVWAGRSCYNIYSITKNPDHLKKAYEHHENAGEMAEKSNFYAGLCAQELYDLTKDEAWKNKALTKYVQYLNSSSPDYNKARNAREHIGELTE